DGLTSPTLQRAHGQIALTLCGNKLEELYQSGCAKLMLPKTYGEMTEAVMLNTSGGITGGDRLNVKIQVENGAVVATSQTAERLYRSITEPAKIEITLRAYNAATLHWLPQETIIFDGAELDRTVCLDMSADSKCLLAETIVMGREAMGEDIRVCHFTDNWRLYREGQLFHAESLRLTDRVAEIMAVPAGGNGARLLSTILYAGFDAEQKAGLLTSVVETCSSKCAMSCWNDRLVIRLMSPHPRFARADIKELLCALSGQPLPRVWQV
ncbi:MAG: urease accessory protein UreD, partial [Candidatus Puniceispirillaceae bacterium]